MGVILKLDRDLTPDQSRQLRELKADVYRNLTLIHAVAVRVPPRNVAAIAGLPFVKHLSLDATTKKDDVFTVNSSLASVAFQQYSLTGYQVGVAVLDSGIQNQGDFGDPSGCRLVGSADFTNEDVNDHCGHGTHVAGIIAGNGQASTGNQFSKTFYGIARRASLIEVKVLTGNGAGTVSNAISGIQWCVANRKKYNIRVLNISFGHPVGENYSTDPLCQAVEAAWQSGIVVVCAAGNEGRLNPTATSGASNEGYGTAYGTIECPGNDPSVITVGAMKNYDGNRADDRIATYSSRGPALFDFTLKPDIVAPGNQIVSVEANNCFLINTYPTTVPLKNSFYSSKNGYSNDYCVLSGTSMATPVVAGAVALMLQQQPTLSPDTVKVRLMESADKWLDPCGNSDPCTYGAGYLDIPNALNCPLVAGQPAYSPTLFQDSTGDVYISINNAIWGKNSIWSTGVSNLQAIWGQQAIWGKSANLLSASHAIWGKAFWSDYNFESISSSGVDLSSSSIAIQGEQQFGSGNMH
jgi:serine protease AprX